MSTKLSKKRINITADSDVTSALISAAKRDGIPVTSKATDLLRIGLELEEDLALTTIANERSKTKLKYIDHESAWK